MEIKQYSTLLSVVIIEYFQGNLKKYMKYLSIKFNNFSYSLFFIFAIIFLLATANAHAFDFSSTEIIFGVSDGSDPQISLLKNKKIKSKYIDINLSKQVMTLYENNAVIGAYKISSGKKSMETPSGTFKIYNKSLKAWSQEYGLYMPYWMSFTPSGSHGIHELPEWPNGHKEGAEHLGIAVSHGCVRLGIGSAKKVYEWSNIGTVVIIHY